MHNQALQHTAAPLDLAQALTPLPFDSHAHHTLRRRRASNILRAADPGNATGQSSPPSNQQPSQAQGSPPSQQNNTPAEEDKVHSVGGLSGSEDEIDIPPADAEPSDPEEPPNTPLADEKRATVVYAARNLINTIDTRPVGTAWFSA